jgi:hypothetical protein
VSEQFSVDNHNSGRWLHVVSQGAAYRYVAVDGYERGLTRKAGWFVIRTCPCHRGERVTRGYSSEAEAWSAVGAMLVASEGCGT